MRITKNLKFVFILTLILFGTVFGQESPSRVVLRQVYSGSLAENKNVNIYLPAGYDESTERYPVVYFLRNHEEEWFNGGFPGRVGTALKEVADDLMDFGLIGKMILVAPNTGSIAGGYAGLGVNMLRPDLAPATGIGTGRFEDYIITDLVKFMDRSYRTIADRNHRGIDGFSYGGYSSIMLAMRNPGIFSSAGSYDGTVMWLHLDDPNTPGTDPDDWGWVIDDPTKNAVFDYPRNVPYMLLHSASDIIDNASGDKLDSIRSVRFHVKYRDDIGSNPYRNIQMLSIMRQKGIRNSIGDGLLCPNAEHDYGYADLHAKGSLIKHWQTFNGAMISAPSVIDFSVTEKALGDTADAVVFNYGPESIIVSSINNSDPSFQLTDIPPLPLTLNAGDTMAFKVQFKPENFIFYTDTVRITSNDPVLPVSKIILQGKGGSFLAKPDVIYAASGPDGLGLYTVDAASGMANLNGAYNRGKTNITSIRVTPKTSELFALCPWDYSYADIMKINSEGGDALYSSSYIHTPGAKKIAFSNDSTIYFSYDNGDLAIADLDTNVIVPVLIGNTGLPISSICFNSVTNELWATASNYPEMTEDRGLYKIRLTPSLDTLRVGLSGLDQVIKDIAFDSKGNLFGISGNQLIRIDTLDAHVTVIGNLGVTNINSIAISPEIPDGIDTSDEQLPAAYKLYQNYPNPFNPTTEIRFALQNDSQVKLSVFNTKGELVANLKNEKMAKGAHAVSFDASALNSGVYFYKIDVNGMAETRKMVLTK